MSRSRDYQRSAVYAWENLQFPAMGDGGMSLEQCVALAAQMYGRRVIVKDGRGCRHATAATNRRVATITLPKWARTREVIAHEVAHWLNHRNEKAPSHGGIFMGYYIHLLAKHCGHDAEALRASAEGAGLRVLMPAITGESDAIPV